MSDTEFNERDWLYDNEKRIYDFKEKLADLLEEYNVAIDADTELTYGWHEVTVPKIKMDGQTIGIKRDTIYAGLIDAEVLRRSKSRSGMIIDPT